MQFKHDQIINAPVDYVFARATNFAHFEKQSSTLGYSFNRHGRSPIGVGTRWNIEVPYRGRRRKFLAELSELVPPRTVSFRSNSLKYQAALSLKFTPVAAGKCRMEMLTVAQARSLGAKLAFKGIRLGRKGINRRINKQMQQLADRLAADYQKDA